MPQWPPSVVIPSRGRTRDSMALNQLNGKAENDEASCLRPVINIWFRFLGDARGIVWWRVYSRIVDRGEGVLGPREACYFD
jgi:hypothetical protein